MSALGQKRTCALQNIMFALPPIATSIAFFGMSSGLSFHSLDRSGNKRQFDLNRVAATSQKIPAAYCKLRN